MDDASQQDPSDGVALLLAMHAVFQGGVVLVAMWKLDGEGYPFTFAATIGVTQLAYVLPAVVILRRRGTERARAAERGVWLGAGVTFLLNAACFGGCVLLA